MAEPSSKKPRVVNEYVEVLMNQMEEDLPGFKQDKKQQEEFQTFAEETHDLFFRVLEVLDGCVGVVHICPLEDGSLSRGHYYTKFDKTKWKQFFWLRFLENQSHGTFKTKVGDFTKGNITATARLIHVECDDGFDTLYSYRQKSAEIAKKIFKPLFHTLSSIVGDVNPMSHTFVVSDEWYTY